MPSSHLGWTGGSRLTQGAPRPWRGAPALPVLEWQQEPGPGKGTGAAPCLPVTPQDNYNLLHKRINHTWDFVVMQAREQLR